MDLRAYSVDLRERVVGAVVAEGWSQAQAARIYRVSEPSVSRFVAAYEAGGDLAARRGGWFKHCECALPLQSP